MAFVLVITVVFVVPIIVCYKIAAHKHLDKLYWTAMAACFGPLAIIPLLFIHDKHVP